MFILPFVQLPQRAVGLQQIWLFLERNGTHLIEVDRATQEDATQYAKEFMELNGLSSAAPPFFAENVVFCPVDPSAATLKDCYTWKETPSGTVPPREVWRTFLWVSSEEGQDPWGVNTLMSGIRLSDDSHTAYSVLKNILDLKA